MRVDPVAIVLVLVLLCAFLVLPARTAPPSIQRPMEIVEARMEGDGPLTVDPAVCYDTASGELLMNVYDTLVTYDGEHVDRFLPQLATEWTIQNITGETSPEGLSWYYRYTFKIRQGVPFQNSTFGNLTTEDVEYCYERAMVMDSLSSWMLYEPLLYARFLSNGPNAYFVNQTDYDPENNIAERVLVGRMIDHAVESNNTHVWFSLAFPGAYSPFMQVLSQLWGGQGIYSKNWATNLGRPVWPGDWGDYTDWWTYHFPPSSPFDDPSSVAMGTGPFILTEFDKANMFWEADRFIGYWRGWPLDWPSYGSSKPAGYVDHLKVTWAYDWTARKAMFLNGDVDFCAVPKQYVGELLDQPNIRCTYPLPVPACDALFFQFNINQTSPYGTIFDAGVIGETGVPRDFFGNTSYGVHVRRAFAQLFDFNSYIQTVLFGEGIQPPTALIPSLAYFNASIPKWTLNTTAATDELKQWPGLWDTGFTIKLLYNTGSLARQTACELLADAISALNPKFHASAVGLDSASYFPASYTGQLPAFWAGWIVDFPDPHDFAYPFYHTYGNFAARAHYSNPTMDALIDQGIRTPDSPERAAIYSQVQQLAIDDCPCVALDMPISRHFEQTWVCGWYYNPSHWDWNGRADLVSVYAANLWKRYYTPHAQLDTVANDTANLLPYDVNHDGRTNMVDIGTAAASFGAAYGPPISVKWNFRCDFNNDRKIDMKDIAGVAKNFGKTSAVWTPSS